MFNCLVKPVLLYGSETWRMDATPIRKVQTFVNSSLRKILRKHWPDRITNEELWRRTRQINTNRGGNKNVKVEMDRSYPEEAK